MLTKAQDTRCYIIMIVSVIYTIMFAWTQYSTTKPLTTTILTDDFAQSKYSNYRNHQNTTYTIPSPIPQLTIQTPSIAYPPYSKCEQKYLGWNQYKQSNQDFGDLSFKPNQLQTLCKNNDSTDLDHAHVECYNVKWKDGHICFLKNIYGYIQGNKLKFKAFCKNPLNPQHQKLLTNFKKSFRKAKGYPLFFDIEDGVNALKNMKTKHSIDYKANNNDLWFYDNSDQCESRKKGDKNHIGNPWHCYAHLEYFYQIIYNKHIDLNQYNTTLVDTRYNGNKFGPNIPIYHFFPPYFDNIITAQSMKQYPNDGFYIKELIIDERPALGFGAGTIWRQDIAQKFQKDKSCESFPRRSQIGMEMRELMINYYDTTKFYSDYDWIGEINNISEPNTFHIHGDLNAVNDVNRNVAIVFIATRWVNGVCRYRCLGNPVAFKDKFVELFERNMKDNVVIVYGNPGILSFRGQYHLFRKTKIFIGVHGAVFLMCSLFMEPGTLKFEIVFPGNKPNRGPHSDTPVNMFGDGIHHEYGFYFCQSCKNKRNNKPSNINIDPVMKQFKTKMHEAYNVTLQ